MKDGSVTLEIVINGDRGDHVAREFVSPMDRLTYVEGREGSSFTLRIRNGNAFRVVAIPSVDGLSVMDGKPAGRDSGGYVLGPLETLDVPGWKVDGGVAARFVFAGMKDGVDGSYAAQTSHGAADKGAIGLIAFREKAPAPMVVGAMRGMSFSKTSKGMSSGTLSASSASMAQPQNSLRSSGGEFEPTSFMEAEEPAQTLGTGFGEATSFATRSITFSRGQRVALIELFYDDRRGLKRRGIEVDRSEPRRPRAFPADEPAGCAPPAGWRR